ncbi:MAG: RNA ligase family protein [Halanaerobiales bacterium]|nr:RNA ligase family protein [Halanaerobiales bacterium]
MEFRKYQHIERFGTDDVKGINLGTCYIFPKIDGTNASVWLDGGEVKAGSRNRELTLENDNQGFYAYIKKLDNIESFLKDHPYLRLYGEWLVPHSLKTYREDAWREFYVFDVMHEFENDEYEYLIYPEYKDLLEYYDIEYIPPLAVIENPKRKNLVNQLDKTGQYLIKDGEGDGEGIVIKNYDFENKYGRTVWAKMVTSRFKEKHHKEMGAPKIKGSKSVEEKIITKYVTKPLIEKEYTKIVNEKDGWKSQYIPMLFGRVFHALVTEETWDIIKKFNKPTIDFSDLRELTIYKIKQVKPKLF